MKRKNNSLINILYDFADSDALFLIFPNAQNHYSSLCSGQTAIRFAIKREWLKMYAVIRKNKLWVLKGSRDEKA